jgi:hypothetical protein
VTERSADKSRVLSTCHQPHAVWKARVNDDRLRAFKVCRGIPNETTVHAAWLDDTRVDERSSINI